MDELVILSNEEWDLLIESMDALKNKGLAGELMSTMFETMLAPKENASVKEKEAWKKGKERKELAKKLKEEEEKKFRWKVELLKAKLVLMRESKEKGRNGNN